MVFENFDIWKFLAGLGIFMFGMFLLEESIKLLSGKTFKRFIKTSTTGKIRSIFTGMTSTAILQSSSAVSLMTLAFVGAGIISMQNAIGVIMGTNLGTTFTGWIVATLGFKIDIEGIALPLIGIGGLGLIFLSKSVRYSGFSKLFVGLGFLFMGLDYMKIALENYTSTIDLSTLPHYGLWFYILLGFLLTAIMQSSSATLAIILTALNSGIIHFDEGASMVIGANIGTTITVLLGAIGGVAIKKQVAASHVIFNIGTGIIAILFLPVFTRLIHIIDGTTDHSNVIDIALFHTLFNLVGVVLFFPFIGLLAKKLIKWFPNKETKVTRYINNVSVDLPEAGMKALHLETEHLYQETVSFAESLLNEKRQNQKAPEQRFEDLKNLQSAISVFGSNIRHGELDPPEKSKIHQTISISLQLSQVSKTLWSIHEEITELTNSSTPGAIKVFRELCEEHNQLLGRIQKLLDDDAYQELSLSNLRNEIESQNEALITKVAHLLNNNDIENKHVSWLILVNGLISHTSLQMLLILHDLKQSKY